MQQGGECSRTHFDTLRAASTKRAQQSMLNVCLGRTFRVFEGMRRRGWEYDYPVAATWHRAVVDTEG